MKKLAWLIFIVSKIKILKGSEDLTEFVFLLFAVIHQVVMLSPADVTCELIESKSSKFCWRAIASFQFLDFKKSVTEKHSAMTAMLDTYLRDHLRQALKTNGAQSDEEIALSIKNIQDMLSKVSPQICTGVSLSALFCSQLNWNRWRKKADFSALAVTLKNTWSPAKATKMVSP